MPVVVLNTPLPGGKLLDEMYTMLPPILYKDTRNLTEILPQVALGSVYDSLRNISGETGLDIVSIGVTSFFGGVLMYSLLLTLSRYNIQVEAQRRAGERKIQ